MAPSLVLALAFELTLRSALVPTGQIEMPSELDGLELRQPKKEERCRARPNAGLGRCAAWPLALAWLAVVARDAPDGAFAAPFAAPSGGAWSTPPKKEEPNDDLRRGGMCVLKVRAEREPIDAAPARVGTAPGASAMSAAVLEGSAPSGCR